jgi:thiamine kinase-like enzyme
MADIITNIEQLTPAWLADLLRTKGLLQNGAVSSITQTKSRQTNVSTVYHLLVTYPKEEPLAPRKLFLKIPAPDFHLADWGRKEFRFYTEIVPAMRERYAWSQMPFIRYYAVAYAKEPERSHYLFEDLSDTFSTANSPFPPTLTHCQKAVDAFALLHAFWWEHPRLLQHFGEPYNTQTITDFITSAQAKFQDFAAFRGTSFSKIQAEVLEVVVSRWPVERTARLIQGKGLTIVHRDPHPLNLLYSTNGSEAGVKLIDWQSWRVDTGTDDLAYWIACHWPETLRESVEHTLLQRYYHQLVQLGVQNYSWPDCWYDYRASIIRCLFFLMAAWSPVQWERGWWWEKVACGIRAFEDLNCISLLSN